MDRKARANLLSGLGHDILAKAMTANADPGEGPFEGDGPGHASLIKGMACGADMGSGKKKKKKKKKNMQPELFKSCGEGKCGSSSSRKKKKKKNKLAAAPLATGGADQGGLTKSGIGVLTPVQEAAAQRQERPASQSFNLAKSWDQHTVDHAAASRTDDRPRLQPPPDPQLTVAAVAVEPLSEELSKAQVEAAALDAIDTALVDSFRFQLTVTDAANPAHARLLANAGNNERPTIPADLVKSGALNAPAPNPFAVVRGAGAALRARAANNPHVAAGLASMGTTERNLIERLARLDLEPGRIAAGI